MKNNFGLGKDFYWSLPREIRRNIVDSASAGFACYNYLKFDNAQQFRRKVRKNGFKSVKDFYQKQVPWKKRQS